ncbi:hypothetical protein GGX14DRAFT_407427 [Mycena pura]|uniref:Uncharacterized protein n=1 Tax=Mycena pura TaxID=153505 RepID=A0AAD6Y0L4_9AGAR|nr:hypothetical protein GGX14DRAFT_407427 [Mycena pura]
MLPDQPPNRQYLISHWTDFVHAYLLERALKSLLGNCIVVHKALVYAMVFPVFLNKRHAVRMVIISSAPANFPLVYILFRLSEWNFHRKSRKMRGNFPGPKWLPPFASEKGGRARRTYLWNLGRWRSSRHTTDCSAGMGRSGAMGMVTHYRATVSFRAISVHAEAWLLPFTRLHLA